MMLKFAIILAAAIGAFWPYEPRWACAALMVTYVLMFPWLRFIWYKVIIPSIKS